MSKVEIELNLEGLNEIMKRATPLQEEIGQQVARNAEAMSKPGAQYQVRTVKGQYINFTHVEPANEAAEQSNYEMNTLLKSLDATGLPKKK